MRYAEDLPLNSARTIRLIAQAWVLLLIAGSLQPGRPGPVHTFHRLIHFVAFGGAMLLFLLLARNRRQEILAVAGLCLLGLSIEYAQHRIYGNVMEWWDVRDDTLAVLGALVLYYVWRAFRTTAKAST